MQAKLSTKGQVVLPSFIRRKLNLRPGDPLDAKIENDRIVLTPRKTRSHKIKLQADPITRLPVLSAGPQAPPLTSKQVKDLLTEFP
jgi:AbrB family looped-hinge helix DNA binding protein